MTTKAKKTLYFVRHAESEQNVATRDLHAGRQGAARRIIDLGWDAPLSETGRTQLEHAKTSAELKAWKDDAKVELIAHSPYVRFRFLPGRSSVLYSTPRNESTSFAT